MEGLIFCLVVLSMFDYKGCIFCVSTKHKVFDAAILQLALTRCALANWSVFLPLSQRNLVNYNDI